MVLCGHSYGGLVVSGVAEKSAASISSIVFLDAFVPENGDSMAGLTSQAVRDDLKIASRARRPRRAGALGRGISRQREGPAWVNSLCVPQPIGTMTEKMTFTGAREKHQQEILHPCGGLSQSGLRHGLRAGQGRQVMAHLRGAVRA